MTRRSQLLVAVDVGAQVFKLETRWWAFREINSKASCESFFISPEDTIVSPDLVVARWKDRAVFRMEEERVELDS